MQDPRTKLQIAAEDPEALIWNPSDCERMWQALNESKSEGKLHLSLVNLTRQLLASHERLRSCLIDAIEIGDSDE